MSSTGQMAARQRDPLALGAFFIALVLLGPIQVGVLEPGLRGGRSGMACLLFVLFFVAVFTPFWASVRRRRREPLLWGSSGFLIATGVILSLDILWFASIMIYQLFR